MREREENGEGRTKGNKIEIDKNKIMSISRDLKRNVLRHTQDPLNLL